MLKYLHSKQVILRYLRPARILAEEPRAGIEQDVNVKVSDVHLMHAMATPLAPEQNICITADGLDMWCVAPEVRKQWKEEDKVRKKRVE